MLLPADAGSEKSVVGRERLRMSARQARWTMMVFAIAAIAAVWAITLQYIERERTLTLDYGRLTAASYARAVAEHANRTFQSADQAVLFYKYQAERVGVRFDLGQFLQTGVVLGDVFNLVSIIDDHGDVVAASKPFTPINLSDREHFKVHVAQDSGRLYISKPVLGRVSGKWSLQMTRRANRPDGSLLGVIVVSMDPFYFSHFYRDLDASGTYSFALIGEDASVRARFAEGLETVGQDLSNAPLFKAIRAHSASGEVTGLSTLDRRQRIYEYHHVEGYPLIAVVGVDVDKVLASFGRTRRVAIGLALAFTLMTLIFCGFMAALVGRLDRARKGAEAASRAKSEFLATMSHELRTPLHGILGYAELLADEVDSGDSREFVASIQKSGSHLLEVVNDVLDIGRIEAGHMELHWDPVPFTTLLEEVVAGHRSSAQLKGLKLSLMVAPEVPLQLRTDATRLRQILNNLVHNAVKFTESGQVEVTASADADQVTIEVADTGPGIARHHLESIFENFVQVSSTLSRRHEGTGLGLPLAQKLAHLLGGHVAVDSELGRGSRFRVTLPLVPPSPQSPSP